MNNRHSSTFRFVYSLLCVSILLSLLPTTPLQAARRTEGEAIHDVPDTVVDESVSSYYIIGTKLFWQNLTPVNCDPDVSSKSYDEFIRRVAVQGSTIRTLNEQRRTDSLCGPSIFSNIVADSDNVYFMSKLLSSDATMLMRMPVLANPGDSLPSIATPIGKNAELLISGSYVYALTDTNGLWRVDRSTASTTRLLTAAQVGANPSNFQSDGKYAYWLVGGQLRQINLETSGVLNFGATDITNYALYASFCFTSNCTPTRHVYMGIGNQIRRFNSDTRLFDKVIWTANEADHRFDEMVVAGNNLFFVEEQTTTCEPFCGHNTLLFRMNRDGNGSPELLYTGSGALAGWHDIQQLTANGNNLYWIDGFSTTTLKRLPQDAAALPMTNLRISNIEITQAIQSVDNDIFVISKKRTFVRVHAKSDGDPVTGVTARLYRLDAPNGNVIGDPLTPSNTVGQYLTVRSNPDRAVMNHSYLFELPMDWVSDTSGLLNFLYLRAEINPYKSPPQASYANNTKDQAAIFVPSPRFDLRFVLFRFVVNGVEFKADVQNDFNQTVSWIRRAYPIASVPTSIGHSGGGFGPGYTIITDNDLKDYITQGECDFDDDMCASDYVHGLLEDWDDDWQFDHAMMYGMMPTYTSPYSGKRYFPRGSTSGDTSNGPTGVPAGKWDWDVDGTYADWYAGHEIGHLLDRDHPTPGGDPDPDESPTIGCGHSQDDDDYPYTKARIDGSKYFGFDPGNPKNTAIMTPTLYAGDGAFDMMSYCHPIQWISDYTYKALYSEMADLAVAQAAISNMPNATGDYLYLYGVVKPAQETGNFVRVRRKNGSYQPTSAGNSDYALKMLNGEGGELATVDVPVVEDHDHPGRFILNADLAYVEGTRTIQLVHKPSSKVYMSHSFSANPPVITEVTLDTTSSPVSGTVGLSWNASDPDGDLLSYDIHYSIDNGATFQPIQANLSVPNTQINTLELGGSNQALLRVTAFDGGHTSTATTAPFILANKPPVVSIVNPADGIHAEYGQLINFIGEAVDPQWGEFADANLQWSSEDGPLGTGIYLSLTDLEVGQHTITFTAKNSAGLEASDSITVYVDDDLAITGPTLEITPNQLGWHFDEGDTTPQSTTLTIANVGSSDFTWKASTPAPWLSLSATQGAANTAITVTADPTLIPPEASADGGISANIMVTATIGAGQFSITVGESTIPAHAAFGNGYTAAFPGPEAVDQESTEVYLPTILSD